MPALAELLTAPTNVLAELDLSGNSLKSEGLATLAGALLGNTTLETLLLADNGIGGSDETVNRSAIEALGEALSVPPETCKM